MHGTLKNNWQEGKSAYRWPLMEDAVTLGDRVKLARFILSSHQFTSGPQVKQFEQQWNEWLGSRHSLFVSSGSTANTLLISSWKEYFGIEEGSKVIVPACTWVTNVGPIIQSGLQPVFCDINLDNYSFSIPELKRIAGEHSDIRAVFVTHLLGFPSDLEEIQSIFPEAQILEDVCESHGCQLKDGKRAGVFDVGGTFSFYYGHHMTTVEGGMVSTNHEDLYDLMRMKRSHGLARESAHLNEYASQNPDIIPQFLFMTDGYNFRNNEIGAVLGLSQLSRLDQAIEIRNANYQRYHQLVLNREDQLHVPELNDRISSFALPFICKSKDVSQKLISLFEENAIEYRPVVSGNLLRQPFLKKYNILSEVPNADILHDYGVYIGNGHFVGTEEMDMLEDILNQL